MSENFIEPFIESLPNRDLSKWDIINPEPIDLDVIKFDYNLTNFRFLEDASYNGFNPIIKIGYDNYNFSMTGVNLSIAFDYEFVSDPPIFADIGRAQVGMTNWYLNYTGESLKLIEDRSLTQISNINTGWIGE